MMSIRVSTLCGCLIGLLWLALYHLSPIGFVVGLGFVGIAGFAVGLFAPALGLGWFDDMAG